MIRRKSTKQRLPFAYRKRVSRTAERLMEMKKFDAPGIDYGDRARRRRAAVIENQVKKLDEGEDEKEEETSKKKSEKKTKNPLAIEKLKIKAEWDPPQTSLMKNKIIPGHPETCFFVAPIGSGKSTLIGNLLKKKNFYNGYFQEIFLFCESPDPTLIDNVPMLKDKRRKRVFNDCVPAEVERILKEAEQGVKNKGRKRSKRYLIILDDCIGNTHFFYSKPVQTMIFNLRHFNLSVWITAQAWVGLRLRHRMQMLNIFVLTGINEREKKKVIDENQPAWLSVKEMNDLIDTVLSEPYSFLFIKKNVNDKTQMFRDNHFNIVTKPEYAKPPEIKKKEDNKEEEHKNENAWDKIDKKYERLKGVPHLFTKSSKQ